MTTFQGGPEDRLIRAHQEFLRRLSARFASIDPSSTGFTRRRITELITQSIDELDKLGVNATQWAHREIGASFRRAAEEVRRVYRAGPGQGGVQTQSGLGSRFSTMNRQAFQALLADPESGAIPLLQAGRRSVRDRLRKVQRLSLKAHRDAINEIIAISGIGAGESTAAMRKEIFNQIVGDPDLKWRSRSKNTPRNRLLKHLSAVPYVSFESGTSMRLDAYAGLVARTKTRQAQSEGTRAQLLDLGVGLIQVSLNQPLEDDACSLYVGRVFALTKEAEEKFGVPLVTRLPNGGTPFHPNCTHTEQAFFAEDVSKDVAKDALRPPPDWALNRTWAEVQKEYKRRGGFAKLGSFNPVAAKHGISTPLREKRRKDAGMEPDEVGTARRSHRKLKGDASTTSGTSSGTRTTTTRTTTTTTTTTRTTTTTTTRTTTRTPPPPAPPIPAAENKVTKIFDREYEMVSTTGMSSSVPQPGTESIIKGIKNGDLKLPGTPLEDYVPKEVAEARATWNGVVNSIEDALGFNGKAAADAALDSANFDIRYIAKHDIRKAKSQLDAANEALSALSLTPRVPGGGEPRYLGNTRMQWNMIKQRAQKSLDSGKRAVKEAVHALLEEGPRIDLKERGLVIRKFKRGEFEDVVSKGNAYKHQEYTIFRDSRAGKTDAFAKAREWRADIDDFGVPSNYLGEIPESKKEEFARYAKQADYKMNSAKEWLEKVMGKIDFDLSPIAASGKKQLSVDYVMLKPGSRAHAYGVHTVADGEKLGDTLYDSSKYSRSTLQDKVRKKGSFEELPGYERFQEKALAEGGTGHSGVFLTPEAGVDVFIHEIGHAMEEQSTSIRNAMHNFLKTRLKSDAKGVRKLSEITGYAYEEWEVAFEDKFFSPYIGKIYNGGRIASTEVFTMGIQALYEDPLKLLLEDREMFRMIVTVLKGGA